jgi:hypothetical protein
MKQVLDLLGFKPYQRTGDQWYGDCPLHESRLGRHRCFSVNVAIGRYRCHRCHSRGNQLELWAAATKLPFYQAAIDLCRGRRKRREKKGQRKRRLKPARSSG